MPRIEHILFPYDFSRPCTLVAPHVRAVASRFGAKVTLLTVYPTAWDSHSPEMLGVGIGQSRRTPKCFPPISVGHLDARVGQRETVDRP